MVVKSFKEEYKNLYINKTNLVVLFIIPILTILLIGVELSKEVIKNIPIAIIDYDNSTFSRQLIDAFNQNETFIVKYYPVNHEHLENLLKNSHARMGMIIPKNFYNDIMLLKSPTILMIYDGSHMSITSSAKARATEILLTYKAGATINQLNSRLNLSYEQAFNIAQAFQFSNRMLYNPNKSFKDFLAPILLPGSIQAALALTATLSINHNIFLKTQKKRMGYSFGKTLFYSICGTLSFMICIILQVFILDITFRGSLLSALVLSLGLSFAVSAFCVLISVLFKKRIIALITGAVLFIPNSVMAGSTWPLISMPIGYQGFAKIMPFAHYANNIRNIYLKGSSISAMVKDIIYLFAFGIVVTLLTELVVLFLEKDINEKESIQDGLSRDDQEGIPLNIQI